MIANRGGSRARGRREFKYAPIILCRRNFAESVRRPAAIIKNGTFILRQRRANGCNSPARAKRRNFTHENNICIYTYRNPLRYSLKLGRANIFRPARTNRIRLDVVYVPIRKFELWICGRFYFWSACVPPIVHVQTIGDFETVIFGKFDPT